MRHGVGFSKVRPPRNPLSVPAVWSLPHPAPQGVFLTAHLCVCRALLHVVPVPDQLAHQLAWWGGGS
jgi:hypothetical protein